MDAAALLLQGSVQVYSRKVEYLYSLVLRALEFLSQKRFVLLNSVRFCLYFFELKIFRFGCYYLLTVQLYLSKDSYFISVATEYVHLLLGVRLLKEIIFGFSSFEYKFTNHYLLEVFGHRMNARF